MISLNAVLANFENALSQRVWRTNIEEGDTRENWLLILVGTACNLPVMP